MDREALAWAAGFFDGEGHVSCRWRRKLLPTYRPVIDVQIPQAGGWDEPPEVLLRFQRAVLGCGRFYGPRLSGPSPPNRPIWKYMAASFEHVQAIACMLWPFLGEVKREQFRRALTQRVEHFRARRPQHALPFYSQEEAV